ncbi:hypothetical protein AVEN_104865-1 [Araneus ventricosus]|uniref:Uncharacterized protein n=1 Tax=Araneus ventricosus TaxID=182803 RepID=A0A4Y2INV9_ARAVE|nr:hypothetical protein AVEN_104865-1 [Araneus ventricosus]
MWRSPLSEARVFSESCLKRLSDNCQLKDIRCSASVLGKEPKYIGNSWERVCKIKDLSLRVAVCVFMENGCTLINRMETCKFMKNDCIMDNRKTSSRIEKKKRARLTNFVVCSFSTAVCICVRACCVCQCDVPQQGRPFQTADLDLPNLAKTQFSWWE